MGLMKFYLLKNFRNLKAFEVSVLKQCNVQPPAKLFPTLSLFQPQDLTGTTLFPICQVWGQQLLSGLHEPPGEPSHCLLPPRLSAQLRQSWQLLPHRSRTFRLLVTCHRFSAKATAAATPGTGKLLPLLPPSREPIRHCGKLLCCEDQPRNCAPGAVCPPSRTPRRDRNTPLLPLATFWHVAATLSRKQRSMRVQTLGAWELFSWVLLFTARICILLCPNPQ